MLRRVMTLGLVGAALASACAETNEAPRVAIQTNLALPKGVLDRVTRLSLTVLEGNVTCDEAAGQTALPGGPRRPRRSPSESSPPPAAPPA